MVEVINDQSRSRAQLLIALALVVLTVGYVGYYAFTGDDTEFQKSLAGDLKVLLLIGAGAAFVYFGLGRKVGSSQS